MVFSVRYATLNFESRLSVAAISGEGRRSKSNHVGQDRFGPDPRNWKHLDAEDVDGFFPERHFIAGFFKVSQIMHINKHQPIHIHSTRILSIRIFSIRVHSMRIRSIRIHSKGSTYPVLSIRIVSIHIQYVSHQYVSIQCISIQCLSIQKVCISRNGNVSKYKTYPCISLHQQEWQ